jgi:hypothetical protein
MNKELANGLIVSGIAVIAYLLYKQFENKQDVVKTKESYPTPVEIELKQEPKLESVVLNF